MPRFCIHSRLLAECPICRRGTPLDPVYGETERKSASTTRRRATAAGRSTRSGATRPRQTATPGVRASAVAHGLEDSAGRPYEVRLDVVPGGVRLAEWQGGALAQRPPRLPADELARLCREIAASGALAAPAAEALSAAGEALAAAAPALVAATASAAPAGDSAGRPAASAAPTGATPPPLAGSSLGRAGELVDEIRVEAVGDGFVRVGRWTGPANFERELKETPVIAPAERLAEAIVALARGVEGSA
ncbi:hypothetical protein JDY09_07440 [Thermoleophilum album]|uniref:hypothetical protein n=1 Tax=Thermoleophilum album TaxID=29539 RepID=UPI00237CD6AF|nr:hypothetical protein [Thermoleophilum album]WDT93215.1 hypothetical protein JDY09_07440 [Thermoleophilum album]